MLFKYCMYGQLPYLNKHSAYYKHYCKPGPAAVFISCQGQYSSGIIALERWPCPSPSNQWMVILHDNLQMWLSKGSWDGKFFPDYLNGPNIIKKALIRGKRESQRQKKKMEWWKQRLKWCILKMEEGGHEQRDTEARKDSLLEPPELMPVYYYLDFSPVKLISDFWSPEL